MLKDILLVVASILIWEDPVSLLQFFGYSVALCGLVWYKLGGDQVRAHLKDLREMIRAGKPAGLAVVGGALLTVCGMVWYSKS